MKQLLENFIAALTGCNTNRIVETAFYLSAYVDTYPNALRDCSQRHHTLLRWARRIVFHGID
jgi:hypothetical protein